MTTPLADLEYDVLPCIGDATKVIPVAFIVDGTVYVATSSIAVSSV